MPADAPALARLAALDSSEPLRGPAVVAEAGGELRAARALADGRTIADPFRPTLALRALLEVRARQLEEAAPPAAPAAGALRASAGW
ncbi:MAG TPA: hypothetical protein VFB42_14330 [Gaiellaceae bacterium]|nr:hypothetical protein [Gaiellaceae bacterium]